MKEQVIDASVALDWFLQETDSAAAQVLMDDSINEVIRLLTPELLFMEVIKALQKTPGITMSLIEKAVAGLWGLKLTVVPLEGKLLKEAGRLAFRLNTTIYETLYLALAIERDCELITANEQFLEKVREAGIEHARGLWE